MTHWTGDQNRIPRKSFSDYASSDEARAEEELIAEIGSLLLATYYGVRGELENHASYVQCWKQNLNEKQVLRAATQAGKIFEWIVSVSE